MMPALQPVGPYEIHSAEQSIVFEQHWNIGPDLVRVQIKRNAYDNQSCARADVFDPVHRCWNKLLDRPIAAMQCHVVSYVQWPLKTGQEVLFNLDGDELVSRAQRLLANAPPRNPA